MTDSMIFALFLKIVHLLISVSLFLKQWISQFAVLGFSFQRKLFPNYHNSSKLPLHLSLLFFEDNVSYEDISKLVVWALALGISHISLFDLNGILKKNASKVKTAIECYREKFIKTEKTRKEIFIYSDLTETSGGYKNGFIGKTRLHIQLLSPVDGKSNIVDITKRICQDVQSNSLELKSIDPSLVDGYIHGWHKFPDPDLLLKFGDVDSTLGYLPWQIRLAEIFSLPSHKDIQYDSFEAMIMRFSKTNQRFGK